MHGPPNPALGILGGGQLAKMISVAAAQLGCRVVILERNRPHPADGVSAQTMIGDWNSPDALLEVASLVDVVTLENEFVDADALAALERHGHKLWPTAATIRTVQDKLLQKQALTDAGLPVPEFTDAPRPDAVLAAARQFGWPLVLKKRRNGYDGKGNATLRSADDIDAAWKKLDGDANALYVEAWCEFAMELGVIITRAQDGAVAQYPVVETVNRDHICHIVKAPAAIASDRAAQAAALARRAVERVGGTGSFGVEMFLRSDGALLINELAPRVHNTGHYTIEACACSQFENHVRAVFGWPLGSPAMRVPAAVMINLLAESDGSGRPQGLTEALEVEGAHVHVYGKQRSVRGRKMGHVTALGANLDEALATAQRAANMIQFGGEA